MRHRMLFAGRCSLFFTVIGALATVSPAAASYAAGPSSTATATPSGTSVKPGHTIYQANWKSKAGSAGWKTPAGSGKWAIVKNLMRYDGVSSSLLLAPYAVNKLTNFAVVAQIKQTKSIAPPKGKLAHIGLVVRASGKTSADGIVGASYLGSSTAASNIPQLTWYQDGVSGANVQPQKGFNLYRIEVRGSDYTFLLNKHKVVEFTVPDPQTGWYVGIDDSYAPIQVKSFKIIALSPPKTPLQPLPAVKSMNLHAADVPSGFKQTFGHHTTNDEVARVDKTTVSAVQSQGRLISYTEGFSSANKVGGIQITSDLMAFSTGDIAQSMHDKAVAGFVKVAAGKTGSQQTSVPNLGDTNAVFMIPLTLSGIAVNVVEVLVRRGAYRLDLQQVFIPPITAASNTATLEEAKAVALAKTVDRRMQAP